MRCHGRARADGAAGGADFQAARFLPTARLSKKFSDREHYRTATCSGELNVWSSQVNKKGRDIGYALATNSCEGVSSVNACTVAAPDAVAAFAVPNPCGPQKPRAHLKCTGSGAPWEVFCSVGSGRFAVVRDLSPPSHDS